MIPFLRKISELEFADLESFFDQSPRPEEDLHVEFKKILPKSKNHDFAEEMVAFANKEGGWVFIGIDEDDDRRAIWPSNGISKNGKDKIEKQVGMPVDKERIDLIIREYVHPEINYELKFFDIPPDSSTTEARVIVLIYIPQSPESPHVTSKRLGIPIRYRTGKALKPLPFDVLDLLRNDYTKNEERYEEIIDSSLKRAIETGYINDKRPFIHITCIPKDKSYKIMEVPEISSIIEENSPDFVIPNNVFSRLLTIPKLDGFKYKTTQDSVLYYNNYSRFPFVIELTTNGRLSLTSNPIYPVDLDKGDKQIIADDYIILSIIWPILLLSKLDANDNYSMRIILDKFNKFQFGQVLGGSFIEINILDIIDEPIEIGEEIEPNLIYEKINQQGLKIVNKIVYALGIPKGSHLFTSKLNNYIKYGLIGYGVEVP